ncbi:MAG: hypothetical protein QW512_04815 [Thermofilaceae archaeon]
MARPAAEPDEAGKVAARKRSAAERLPAAPLARGHAPVEYYPGFVPGTGKRASLGQASAARTGKPSRALILARSRHSPQPR